MTERTEGIGPYEGALSDARTSMIVASLEGGLEGDFEAQLDALLVDAGVTGLVQGAREGMDEEAAARCLERCPEPLAEAYERAYGADPRLEAKAAGALPVDARLRCLAVGLARDGLEALWSELAGGAS